MLHESDTWPLTRPDLQHLRRNDRAMIRQIRNVKPEDVATVRSNELLARLEINDLERKGFAGLNTLNDPVAQFIKRKFATCR